MTASSSSSVTTGSSSSSTGSQKVHPAAAVLWALSIGNSSENNNSETMYLSLTNVGRNHTSVGDCIRALKSTPADVAVFGDLLVSDSDTASFHGQESNFFYKLDQQDFIQPVGSSSSAAPIKTLRITDTTRMLHVGHYGELTSHPALVRSKALVPIKGDFEIFYLSAEQEKENNTSLQGRRGEGGFHWRSIVTNDFDRMRESRGVLNDYATTLFLHSQDLEHTLAPQQAVIIPLSPSNKTKLESAIFRLQQLHTPPAAAAAEDERSFGRFDKPFSVPAASPDAAALVDTNIQHFFTMRSRSGCFVRCLNATSEEYSTLEQEDQTWQKMVAQREKEMVEEAYRKAHPPPPPAPEEIDDEENSGGATNSFVVCGPIPSLAPKFTPAPAVTASVTSTSALSNETDWECQSCLLMNGASLTVCRSCETPRDGASTAVAAAPAADATAAENLLHLTGGSAEFSFGAAPSATGGFSFGAQSNEPMAAAATSTANIAAAPTQTARPVASSSGFSFGPAGVAVAETSAPVAAGGFSFGVGGASGGFSFGSASVETAASPSAQDTAAPAAAASVETTTEKPSVKKEAAGPRAAKTSSKVVQYIRKSTGGKAPRKQFAMKAGGRFGGSRDEASYAFESVQEKRGGRDYHMRVAHEKLPGSKAFENSNNFFIQWTKRHSDNGVLVQPCQQLVLIQLQTVKREQLQDQKHWEELQKDAYLKDSAIIPVFHDTAQSGFDDRQLVCQYLKVKNPDAPFSIDFQDDLVDRNILLFVQVSNGLNYTECVEAGQSYLELSILQRDSLSQTRIITPKSDPLTTPVDAEEFSPFVELPPAELVKLSASTLSKYYHVEDEIDQQKAAATYAETKESQQLRANASNQMYGSFKGTFAPGRFLQSESNQDSDAATSIIPPLQNLIDQYAADADAVLSYKLYQNPQAKKQGAAGKKKEKRSFGISGDFRFFKDFWPLNKEELKAEASRTVKEGFVNMEESDSGPEDDENSAAEKEEADKTLLDICLTNGVVSYMPHSLFYGIPIHAETIAALDDADTTIDVLRHDLVLVPFDYKTSDKWSPTNLEVMCDDKLAILKDKLKLINDAQAKSVTAFATTETVPPSSTSLKINLKNIPFASGVEDRKYFLFISCEFPASFVMKSKVHSHYVIADRYNPRSLKKEYLQKREAHKLAQHLTRVSVHEQQQSQKWHDSTNLFMAIWNSSGEKKEQDDESEEADEEDILEDNSQEEGNDDDENESNKKKKKAKQSEPHGPIGSVPYLIVANPFWDSDSDGYHDPLTFSESEGHEGVLTAAIYARVSDVWGGADRDRKLWTSKQKSHIEKMEDLLNTCKSINPAAASVLERNQHWIKSSPSDNGSDWILVGAWVALIRQERNAFYSVSKAFAPRITRDINTFSRLMDAQEDPEFMEWFRGAFDHREAEGPWNPQERHQVFFNRNRLTGFTTNTIRENCFTDVREGKQHYYYCAPSIEKLSHEAVAKSVMLQTDAKGNFMSARFQTRQKRDIQHYLTQAIAQRDVASKRWKEQTETINWTAKRTHDGAEVKFRLVVDPIAAAASSKAKGREFWSVTPPGGMNYFSSKVGSPRAQLFLRDTGLVEVVAAVYIEEKAWNDPDKEVVKGEEGSEAEEEEDEEEEAVESREEARARVAKERAQLSSSPASSSSSSTAAQPGFVLWGVWIFSGATDSYSFVIRDSSVSPNWFSIFENTGRSKKRIADADDDDAGSEEGANDIAVQFRKIVKPFNVLTVYIDRSPCSQEDMLAPALE